MRIKRIRSLCILAKALINKHSTKILTGVAITGTAASVYFAVKATKEIENELEAQEHIKGEELTKKEKAKIIVKHSIPTAVSVVATGVSIVGMYKSDAKKIAKLTSLCELSDIAYDKYKDKVIELFGEEANEKVKHKLTEDLINSAEEPPSPGAPREGITKGTPTWVFEPFSKQYIWSDYYTLRDQKNKFNDRILKSPLSQQFESLDEWLFELGIESWDDSLTGHCEVNLGSELGFRTGNLLDFHLAPYEYTDGSLCWAIVYEDNGKPVRDYLPWDGPSRFMY